MRRRPQVAAALIGGTLLISGCSGKLSDALAEQPGSSVVVAPTITTTTTEAQSLMTAPVPEALPAADVAPTAPSTTLEAPGELDPDNVVAAALVIASDGDIESALLNGEFTVEEVEAAVEAIETGALTDYLE